jgi:S-DNA-T family DNA segregation ATPase FtsK/SpoIIIE
VLGGPLIWLAGGIGLLTIVASLSLPLQLAILGGIGWYVWEHHRPWLIAVVGAAGYVTWNELTPHGRTVASALVCGGALLAIYNLHHPALAGVRDWPYLTLALLGAMAVGGYALWETATPSVRTMILLSVLVNGVLVYVHPENPIRVAAEDWLLRHRWATGCEAIKVAAPIVGGITRAATGATFTTRLGDGHSVADLERCREKLAASMSARGLRVEEDGHAGQARVTVQTGEPLAEPTGPWPWLTTRKAGRSWGGIPVGRDEAGETVFLSLAYNSVLIAGLPDSGKSVALQQIVAGVAGDPSARLYLIDGKRAELSPWKRHAASFAVDGADAVAVLEELRTEMGARYAWMEAQDGIKRKVVPADDKPLLVCVVDELAAYTGPSSPVRDAFDGLLQDLILRGRAAGVVLVLATQKPTSDVISTQVRDNVSLRWALRVSTDKASAAIVGDYEPEAQKLPKVPGIGYLCNESGGYRKLRTFYLTDEDIERLAA